MVYDVRYFDGRNSGNANRVQKIRPGTVRRQMDVNNPRYKIATPYTPTFMPYFPSQRVTKGQLGTPLVTARQKALIKLLIKELMLGEEEEKALVNENGVATKAKGSVAISLIEKLGRWINQGGQKSSRSASFYTASSEDDGVPSPQMMNLEGMVEELTLEERDKLEETMDNAGVPKEEQEALTVLLNSVEAEAEQTVKQEEAALPNKDGVEHTQINEPVADVMAPIKKEGFVKLENDLAIATDPSKTMAIQKRRASTNSDMSNEPLRKRGSNADRMEEEPIIVGRPRSATL